MIGTIRSPAAGVTSSALAKRSVIQASSGGGQVTTLRQVRQSATAAFAGRPSPLGGHRAKLLSAREVPAMLERLFGRN
ncbi:MAG: hypothetical protein LBT57_02455 [Puniceicoccales bacterium]|nr:hypothetical protein [Puniceicoccales bacterium]